MSWKENMYASMAEYLREVCGQDAVEVLDFEDTTVYGGFCETCSYETVECVITYKNSDGKIKTYNYYSSFADLIGALS